METAMKRMITIIACIISVVYFSISLSVPALSASSSSSKNKNEKETSRPTLPKGRLIEGLVVDENNHGIGGADVVLPQKGVSVKTDNSGSFELSFEGIGRMHLEIYKTGFMVTQTKAFDVKLGETGHIHLPKITMYPTPLEEVVVTGTSTPKLYREAPVKTAVATKSQIEKKGALSLADSLEIMTGVRVEDNCQNCNFTQVRLNGMEGKYSQILIDGMPVVSALAGVYALEQIPANMIDKLEVVKGGGSALYGGNAVAGVVNIVTRENIKPGTGFSLTQELINGEPNTALNINTDIASKSYASQTSFFASYQNRKQMDYNDDGFSDLGKLQNLNFGVNFTQTFDDIRGKLKLTASFISEDRRGGNRFDEPEHMADIAESIRTRRSDIAAGWEHTLSEKSMLKAMGSFSFTSRKSYYGSQQDPNAYGDTTNPVIYGTMTYQNFSLKNHSVVAGVSFQSDHIKDLAPAYDRIIDATYTDLGIFVQDEISVLSDKASILLGIRMDKHSEVEDMILSPRLSVVYKGLQNITLRGTFSTGFRAPQVFDEDLHITQVGGEGMIIVNRAGLKEEKSYSYTVGLDFGKQSGNTLYQFSIGGFFNTLNNVFTLKEIEPLPNAMVLERFNSDAANVYGVELEAGIKLAGRLELFTGWTFQRSELDTPDPDFNSKDMFRSPNVYGNIRLDWNIRKLANLNIDLNFTGSMKVPHYAGYIEKDRLETTPSFWVTNMTLSKDIDITKKDRISLSLSVLNLFDQFQKDLDRGIFRDAGYIYGPRYPRTIRAGIKYKF